MCNAGVVPLIMQTAGTFTQADAASDNALAQQKQILAEQSMARSNARLARWNAQDALERGHTQELRYRKEARQQRSAARAQQGASGVDATSGSVVAMFAGMDAVEAADVSIIQENTARDVLKYRFEEGQYNARARAGGSGPDPGKDWMNSFIGGASQVASNWYQYSKNQ